MAKTTTSASELSCPICLVSSNDSNPPAAAESSSSKTSNEAAEEEQINFLATPCDHVFCQPCIERVLLKPSASRRGNTNSIPTRAPCPMCREVVNLFDMRCATSSVSAYAGDSDVTSWPVANFQYKQRCLIPMENPEDLLQRVIDQKGVIEGHGIKFCFNGSTPSVEFARPLRVAFYCDWTEIAGDDEGDNRLPLDSIAFDQYHFHKGSMTFHGSVTFTNPTCSNRTYFFEKLSCLLHFSENGHYIRKGNLRWKLARTPATSYPMDGSWEVQHGNGNSMIIQVQKHFFSCLGLDYKIIIDQHSFCPRFSWPGRFVEQTSEQKILPGTSGPGDGETVEWRTNAPGHERIVWKRLTRSDWKSVDIQTGNFVYQKCNQHADSEQPLGPSYHSDSIWGNTFCQAYCVGLASYHFLEGLDSDGNFHAYISYENPRTEVWPPLDNNNAVPSRVPFRNISWEPETRTFKGDICWEEDFDTTWMNESKWCYELIFDPTFMFVVSGTCTRSTGEPHQFGHDLIYINAALETPLQGLRQTTQSTGEYLDTIRKWRDDNASSGTLEMMGEVAMAVISDRESLFDFNL